MFAAIRGVFKMAAKVHVPGKIFWEMAVAALEFTF
jgi:hypothetical protein